ncbi:L-fuculose-phosphate aldolase [Streptococcus suis]|nr:L-fuculose-phosphate aldolase [Streptococcus suis]
MQAERKAIIAYGKKLVEDGHTRGTSGNISVFDREQKLMAITPSGIDFFELSDEDIVILDMDGQVVEGSRKPSSEWYMHLIQYQNRDDINAVIHGHTIYGTVLSCLRETLPASHYMIAVAGRDVRVAEYATFGTEALAQNALKGMANRKAVFLANHGILAGESDLAKAYSVVEEVEYCAKLYCIARSIGEPVILSDEEMTLMAEKFKTYGQQ